MTKMSMKEAGRYSNFLSNTILSLEEMSINGYEDKIKKVTTKHLKSLAKPELKDEIVEEEFDSYISIKEASLEDIDRLLDELILEKVLLTKAINEGKEKLKVRVPGQDLELGIDSAIEYSKQLRQKSNLFYFNFLNLEESSYKGEDTGYTFNIEGNQVPFLYKTETKVELLFDKKKFKEKEKSQLLLADQLSNNIDQAMTEEVINYQARWSYLDSIDDILEEFIG